MIGSSVLSSAEITAQHSDFTGAIVILRFAHANVDRVVVFYKKGSNALLLVIINKDKLRIQYVRVLSPEAEARLINMIFQ